MSFAATLANTAETMSLPDPLLRLGIKGLVGHTRRSLAKAPGTTPAFIRAMDTYPIALNPDDANRQHYELPPEFFGHILGPRRKYSCAFYPTGRETLAEAEEHALEETMAHALLADGQDILELGCGWGALSLFMAERFPQARITAVSNSAPQRAYIEARAQLRGLGNLRVITADMNGFTPEGVFDRVVSVEMFEHMANWRALLSQVRGWLKPGGRLFLHVFTHDGSPYRFNHEDEADWIARHFFTGGIMPSHDLAASFPDLFSLERDWRWPGTHYARTARSWLENYDARAADIRPLLAEVYGAGAEIWARRWRLFFLATEGLFGHGRGRHWGVGHYRLAPVP
jgi:cyclopropane-fatty-acyl-phospholipid synthase